MHAHSMRQASLIKTEGGFNFRDLNETGKMLFLAEPPANCAERRPWSAHFRANSHFSMGRLL
jgi:hypothetical protein